MQPKVKKSKYLALVAVVAGVLVSPESAAHHPVAGAPDCNIFPASNPWNQKVDDLPVAKNSKAIINSIGANDTLHPDFGEGKYEGFPIGIPITVVGEGQKKSKVSFQYASESDKGPYPIPKNVDIEGNPNGDGDRHALLVHKDECKLYELYALRKKDGKWRAGSGAIWDLNSNKLRPKGWTSADAAGLPIVPGLARFKEVKAGVIDHALRFTVSESRRKYIYPARHFASDNNDPDLPPMGLRLRLKKGYDISDFPKQAKVVLQALKTYGMMVADNGSDWFISGEPNKNWDNDQLHTLKDVPGNAFQVVDTSSLKP